MIHSSSPVLLRWIPENTGSEPRFPPLQEGEVVLGKVVNPIDSDHAVLHLKGEDFLVETQTALPEGMEGHFLVEGTSPKVVLRLLPDTIAENRPENWIVRYLSRDLPIEDLTERLSGLWRIQTEAFPEEARETVRQLLNLFEHFSLKYLSQDPVFFQEAVARSGLFFESKLKHLDGLKRKDQLDSLLQGDLKSLVMKLRSELASSPGPLNSPDGNESPLENLLKGLDQFVQKLEFYQILNFAQPDPKEKISLLFPLWFPNDLQFVELNLSLPRKDSRSPGEEGFSVLFLLHLPQLGRMKVDVKMKGKGLYCLFTVPDLQVEKFIEQAIPDLIARLDRLGFQSHVHTSTEPLPKMVPSLIQGMGEGLKSLVSVVV